MEIKSQRDIRNLVMYNKVFNARVPALGLNILQYSLKKKKRRKKNGGRHSDTKDINVQYKLEDNAEINSKYIECLFLERQILIG